MTFLFAAAHPLATVNAALNGTATILLLLGYVLIKNRREKAHTWTMYAAFAVSTAFLICYLAYHYLVGHVSFSGPSEIRPIYIAILFSHVLLAILVPFLALRTIYLGLKDDRPRHRWWAKRTFPIWLYVSITGVIIYLMLYVLYSGPPA
jgi:putative membrane protein